MRILYESTPDIIQIWGCRQGHACQLRVNQVATTQCTHIVIKRELFVLVILTQWIDLQKVKDVLVVEKKIIEDNEDREFNLEEKHYARDEDCAAAGWDISVIWLRCFIHLV